MLGSAVVNMKSVPAPRRGVSAHSLDDELVLYHPDATGAYVLNATAGRIWKWFDG